MSENLYAGVVQAIERMHRQSLDTVKIALEAAGLRDLTAVQAMMLYTLAGEEISVGELGRRGAYIGSNISYNVKKMVENGYVESRQSPFDKRSTVVRPTARGQRAVTVVAEEFEAQRDALRERGIDVDALAQLRGTLAGIEAYWAQLRR